MKITLLSILLTLPAGLFIFAVGLLGWGMSTYNTAKQLQVTYEAKISANTADFDNMKKVISQSAEVSEVQFEKLQNIFVSYAEARTEEASGALMRWVQESVPNVDTTVMTNLQNILVAQRNGWTSRQKELVDLSREYNTMLVRFPSNILLGAFNMERINPLVITSSNTQKAFESGEDNDVKIF